MDPILNGMSLVFNAQTLIVIIASAAFGMFVGAIPGLTATMAVSLLVPVTYFMEPIPAIAAMVTTAAVTIFAGDIPGAYLRIPGTPSSAAYVEEAYAFSQHGKASECLGIALVCSVIGGIAGTLVLIFVAPYLAEVALKFSSFEYFWLAVLGLSCAIFISPGSRLKGLLSLCIGLFLATIGLNTITGSPRFTFDVPDLMAGVNFIPVMIGMFAIAEVMKFTATPGSNLKVTVRDSGKVFGEVRPALRTYWKSVLRGSSTGSLIGVLPGAGADIAAWMSYAISRKCSRTPEKFGTGHIEGIVEAGSSNNAAVSGSWVPALVFGIPGDSITAVVIGVLYMKGMNPGPAIFLGGGEMIYALFTVFIVANLIMLPVGYLAIRAGKGFVATPARIVMPVVLAFCVVGAYSINNSSVDIVLMLIAGVCAYGLGRAGFPIAPIILGLVLGGLLEKSFMTSMMRSDGNLLEFFSRPISAGLGILVLLVWLLPVLLKSWQLVRRPAKPMIDAGKGAEG
ncbi:tripartite tricarboxylate transporter permease [Thauera sp. SDU_THAU2]|uniref:tripartite tricarboxylate transporter permease n=1 Tax=Thauera sp. SDU_THAU2 TaxID=3136633 RepID=UPI00311DA6F5